MNDLLGSSADRSHSISPRLFESENATLWLSSAKFSFGTLMRSFELDHLGPLPFPAHVASTVLRTPMNRLERCSTSEGLDYIQQQSRIAHGSQSKGISRPQPQAGGRGHPERIIGNRTPERGSPGGGGLL